jgi:hypothetical protein
MSMGTTANGADFHILTNNCKGKTLPANGAMACTVIVFFKPSMLGQESGTLTAVANPGGTATSALTGNGVTQGTLAVTPNPGAFNGVNQGASSKITFQVSNNGGAPSGVPMVSVSGANANMNDFKVTANNCTAAIPANTMNGCQIEVTFTPTTTMGESATLNIAATPGGTTVPLTGTGTQPAIAITQGPNPWNCNAFPGQTTTQSFTITNKGMGPTYNALSLSVPNSGFSVQNDLCSTKMLNPGDTCTFGVQYAPPMSEKPGQMDTSSVVVTDTMADNVTLTLNGTALASGVNLQMSSSPTPAVYAASGASVTFTVQNWGIVASGMLGMPAVSAMQSAPTTGDISSDFMVTNNNCTMALKPAQSCSYSVVFTAPVPNPDAGADAGPIGGMFTGSTSIGDGTNSASDNFSGDGY